MTRHLLEIDDLNADELEEVLERCTAPHPARVLDGRGAALIFQKPSNRTRNSTEMAVVELGGHPIYLKPDEVDIDGRETAEDVARTLACYHSVIAARVFDHTVLERMAGAVTIPVVNLLSDLSHPLQAIADLLTIRAEFGPQLGGRSVTWVGDYSNVARSLGLACSMQGMRIRFSCPEAYQPPAEDLMRMAELGADWAEYDGDPQAAAEGTDVLVTDAWYSMGQEEEAALRKPIFERYRVDQALLDRAHDDAIFMHCLPAHRGEEVTNEVLDGPRSRVWPEAANRQPAARGALEWLVGASEAGR
ncbi:ornithine carbamoyltransferase [Aquihabitans sp. McL0605]|uniref:ornithine carbamoyltransferase n=1 Tax=Aquihabitans sp. McL0605 TaxID=3415671 RepID=UPI003CFA8E36